MKRWKCTACGYIHTGDAAPEKCPVCGASQDRFVDDIKNGAPQAAPAGEKTAGAEQKIKKWKCTVCGYIHIGAEPPEKCPVCGVPKNRFVELIENGTPQPAPDAPAEDVAADPEQEIKQWTCGVCGYAHTGATAPEKCPVCGAPEDRFAGVVAEDTPKSAPAAASGESIAQAKAQDETDGQAPAHAANAPSWFRDPRYRVVFEMMTRYHGHPISVHIPNGLLPVTVLFIFLSALFGFKGMTVVATYNLGVVALCMPIVLFSGWVDWQNRFNGVMTQVFRVKIACGIIVTVTAWLLFIWLLINPDVVTTSQASRVAFFMINLVMLGAAGTAGWYGGKLVFRDSE